MVKIKNIFGDEYQGKQKNAVYQKRYGKQIRRIKEDKKRNDAPAQREQQQRFRVGLSWYSSLSYVEKEGLKQFLNERGINLTAQQYAIKIALDRGRVTKRVEQERILATTYKAGWDAEGWPYRQRITISNSNAYDLTDYQVKLTLSTDNVGPNFRWDLQGRDIRFYDEAGNKLSYYIESWDEVNQTATVWVKVGSIPAQGTADIFMYYGNPDAQSESNQDDVFILFDDFNGSDLDLNKWTPNYTGNISYEVVDSNLRIYDGYKQSNEFWIYDNTDSGSQIKANVDLTDDYIIIEWKQKMETQTSADQMGEVGLGLAKADKAFEVYNAQGDGNAYFIRYEAGASSFIGGSKPPGTSITADTYYIMSIIKAGTGYTLKAQGLDGSNVFTYTGTSTSPVDYLAIGVGTYEPYPFSKMQIDWVRVRKYASVEPHASLGSEEYGLVESYTTIQVEYVIVEHSGIRDIYILDENEEEITRFTNLSNLAEGDIKTRWDWVNDTGKTVRYVIITSLSGTVNKVRL